MSIKVKFFEIPAKDFNRAISFYENIFNVKLKVMEDENEKMGFFIGEKKDFIGAVSTTKNFEPSNQGVLLSFQIDENMEKILSKIKDNDGKIQIPKTKISGNKGYFSTFLDCEGNRIGLYSDE